MEKDPSSRPVNAFAWMVIAQIFFAGMNVCTRLGADHLPWSEIASTRFFIGAVIAYGLAQYRGSSLRITDRPNTWRRSVLGTFAAICSFYALASNEITVGDAATLNATAPIFVALLSGPLLGERVGGQIALAIALGFAGILAVVRPSLDSTLPVAAIATLGAVCYALAMVWLRKIGPGETHEAIVFHFSLVALGITLAFAIPAWQWPDWRSGLFLLGVGLTGGGAQMAMTRAYSLHRAAPITALSGLGIVLTHLLAAPIFGDRPTGWQVAGSLLVIGSSLLLAAVTQPSPSSPSSPPSPSSLTSAR